MSAMSSFYTGMNPWSSGYYGGNVYRPMNFAPMGASTGWFNTSPRQSFSQPAPWMNSRPVMSGSPMFGGFANPSPTSPFSGQPATAAPTAQGTRPLYIAEIDQFSTDGNGFNHGQTIAEMLRSGGSDPSLSGNVQLLQYNVAGGNATANIAGALQSVIQRVQSGQPVDAVNISQQDFSNNMYTAQVRQGIGQLTAMGIPVAVAAGNYGSQYANQLAPSNSFIVQSADNGFVNSNSGPGNVVSNGSSTSFATANLTPLLAQMKAAGMSLFQMFQQLTGQR